MGKFKIPTVSSTTNKTVMLDNIYVADVNTDALNGYRESLKKMAALFWGIELQEDYFEQHLGTGLLVDVTAAELNYISYPH